jgi:hypothetical protein
VDRVVRPGGNDQQAPRRSLQQPTSQQIRRKGLGVQRKLTALPNLRNSGKRCVLPSICTNSTRNRGSTSKSLSSSSRASVPNPVTVLSSAEIQSHVHVQVQGCAIVPSIANARSHADVQNPFYVDVLTVTGMRGLLYLPWP